MTKIQSVVDDALSAATEVRSPFDRVLAAMDEDRSSRTRNRILQMAADYLEACHEERLPAATALSNSELTARFRERLPDGLGDIEAILARIRDDIIPNSRHLNHPMTLGHQLAAPLPLAIWMESLVSAMNQSMVSWDLSPAGTAIEHEIIGWFAKVAGFGPDTEGTLTFGGTESNLTALATARGQCRPESWTQGVAAPMSIVCGSHVHYSVARAAGVLGLGTDHIIKVDGPLFTMDPQQLERQLIRQHDAGSSVIAVVATAGSTATGSFDPIDEIADVCQQHGVWLHVDGAHGAGALLSDRHRHRVRGIQRADSLSWDAHKMMLVSLNTGILLVSRPGALGTAYQQNAPYLFDEQDDPQQRPDLGKTSLMTSRRADAIKLWACLQRYGRTGFEALYDHMCEVTSALYDALAVTGRFDLPHAPHMNILCFRLRVAGDGDVTNRLLRSRYNASGRGWISSTTLNGRYMLRVTVNNARTQRHHVHALVEGLLVTAEEIET